MRGDLTTYAGRAKRRPPGASSFTQRLYRLLHEHPEGLTRDQIHDALREGWMETDAYRAYERYLRQQRGARRVEDEPYERGAASRVEDEPYERGAASRVEDEPYERGAASRVHHGGRTTAQPGTPDFNARAQRWWIIKALASMNRHGTARREGDLWLAGRPPLIQGQKSSRVPFDPEESRAVLTTTTAEHVNRENAKAILLKLLNNGRIKGHTREEIQAAYDWLCGRKTAGPPSNT